MKKNLSWLCVEYPSDQWYTLSRRLFYLKYLSPKRMPDFHWTRWY